MVGWFVLQCATKLLVIPSLEPYALQAFASNHRLLNLLCGCVGYGSIRFQPVCRTTLSKIHFLQDFRNSKPCTSYRTQQLLSDGLRKKLLVPETQNPENHELSWDLVETSQLQEQVRARLGTWLCRILAFPCTRPYSSFTSFGGSSSLWYVVLLVLALGVFLVAPVVV